MMKRIALLVSIATASMNMAAARADASTAEPKTQAAVLAADDEWLADELRGDVSSLNARLADEYRDIEPDGKVHPKAELLAHTANRAEKATGSTAEVAGAFRKAHPVVEQVVIVGDTAIVSFHSVDAAALPLVRSVDVFSYDRGMWRGVLSKHSDVAGQPSS